MQALFQHICAQLSLGDMIAAPVSLSGGYTHRMFSVTTTQGKYAVKLLNPEIMARPDAADNYARAEAHEAAFEAAGLPILPAKVIGGRKMQCVDGQYLYVFDFYPGRVLQDSEITPAHCAAMGEVLARIHSLECASPQTDRPEGAVSPGPTEEAEDIDWPPLVAALLRDPEARWHGSCMHRALPMLIRVTRAMENASARLPRREALCHNDMDAKNVLWYGSDYRIIDLECIGFANPEQELLDLAVSWAGCDLNEAKFRAFIESYRAAGGRILSDPADLFDSRRNHLDWLAYNARRALHSDMEERRTGREQIEETLEKLAWDQRNRSRILVWLSEY
ncbi:MAG: phosphotransferase [Clostridia bacterium]|nr:phosphotransferase [Clostridia bacterium]